MRLRVCSASLAVFLFAIAAQGQTQEGAAQTRFNKGRELFIAGKFAPALVEFRAATELYESPNTRLYIARCERELGHAASAYIELERAASEAADRAKTDPRYTSTRDVAKTESAALESKIAHVTILAPAGLPEGATITVNGAPLGAAAVGVAAPIDPGALEVIAKAPGYVTTRKNAQANAGEAIEIKVQLDKEPTATVTTNNTNTNTTANTNANASANTNANANAGSVDVHVDDTPRPSRGLRNAGFVVGGIGIAGMGAFAVFAGLAQTRFDQLKTECGGHCDPNDSRISEGQTYQNIANVTLAASGAAIAVGAIMIIAGVSTGNSHPPPVNAAVSPLPGGGFLFGVGRAF